MVDIAITNKGCLKSISLILCGGGGGGVTEIYFNHPGGLREPKVVESVKLEKERADIKMCFSSRLNVVRNLRDAHFLIYLARPDSPGYELVSTFIKSCNLEQINYFAQFTDLRSQYRPGQDTDQCLQ